jgi:hypothetical protein
MKAAQYSWAQCKALVSNASRQPAPICSGGQHQKHQEVPPERQPAHTMSSWRPGDAPRGRDYRDGPPPQNYYPPQRYDDRRGRSRSRDRGPPPGRYEDRGPPGWAGPPRGGPGYGYQGRGGPGYGNQGYGRQGPPGYDGPPRGGYQGRDVYPRQRRPDQPIRKGRIGPRPSRECIALNRELTNPRTDVLQLFSERGHEFNGVNLATAIYQLAKRRVNGSAAVERMLERAAERINSDVSEFDARALANCAWGAVKLGSSNMRILDAVADATPRVLEDFNPQAIANTLWAFATKDVAAPDLFETLSNAALPLMDRFNAQDLGNTAWACAKAEKCDSRLFQRIEAQCCRTLHKFEPQNISNVVWSFATAGIPAPNLFRAVADGIVEDGRRNSHRWRRFNAQAFANLVWAYATVKHDHPQMFDVISNAAMTCFDQFDPQNLANFAWAYATVERASPQLFGALAQALLPRLDDFIAEGLSSTAWAYAKAGIPAPALFREIAKRAQAKLGSFNHQALYVAASHMSRLVDATIAIDACLASTAWRVSSTIPTASTRRPPGDATSSRDRVASNTRRRGG